MEWLLELLSERILEQPFDFGISHGIALGVTLEMTLWKNTFNDYLLKDFLNPILYFHQKHLTYPTDHAPLADLCWDMIWWKIFTIDLRKYLKASQSKNNWCSTDYAGDRCEAGAEHYCHRWSGN